ncbi:MAG TPA: glutathione peroxidase [Sphingobacteriaceae bacterium]
MSDNSIYQFTVKRISGEEVSLSEFKGKVLLIVNTASGCGFTPQYRELEQLRKDFESEDFEILAFPSNDFGDQEPLQGSAIMKFCKINFGIKFSVFDKIHVRGRHAHPLYKFLSDKTLNQHIRSKPKWNFHKYLVDRNGEVTDFFYPFTKPGSGRIRRRITKLLHQSESVS